ncbi:nucleolar [Piromyces finnis]|uniref:Nucleolar n=1 Tax=Piromyces finnis TaxID=1754191 RepID=A0A1Y1UXK1_9FUNG|nr:nucleolar [Piromyces finnis]|eukprot:ORX42960.1 nucleolar [Piromyces finnis]
MVEKSNNNFGKKLASTDKKTRDNAVKSLSKFLSHKKNLSDLELLKLWKGLFYCYWMSDKQLIQQQLANQLGSLLLKIPNEMVFKFLRAFWKIIISEWNGLDRLRIDKYYYLMRRMHYYTFKFLEKVNWRKQYVLEYVDLYDTGPLCFLNDKIPRAIHYHICEVFFQIFEEAVEKSVPKKAFQKLLEPFIDIVTFSFDFILIEHATSEIFLYLYKQLSKGKFLLMQKKI